MSSQSLLISFNEQEQRVIQTNKNCIRKSELESTENIFNVYLRDIKNSNCEIFAEKGNATNKNLNDLENALDLLIDQETLNESDFELTKKFLEKYSSVN